MIYVRGDCHGDFTWLNGRFRGDTIIILGDAGINFFLNKRDERTKQHIMESGVILYCVRGNHEARPQSLSTMVLAYDPIVEGEVYYEPEYPNIKYFKDYGIYTIGGYKIAVIGGAYSVDKFYRILRAGCTEENNDPRRTFWFADEQLSAEERAAADKLFAEAGDVDIVMSHTCPYSWQPTDLFLRQVDQSTVDNSMELWLDKVAETLNFKCWIFGHYHVNRKEAPNVMELFDEIKLLDKVFAELTKGES